jgi:hypothetical protein
MAEIRNTTEKQQFASIIPSPVPENLRLEPTLSNTNQDIPNLPSTAPDAAPKDGEENYDKYSSRRKRVITLVLGFCSFLAPVSSTTVLSAVPEVAETFGCDGGIVNLSNAM